MSCDICCCDSDGLTERSASQPQKIKKTYSVYLNGHFNQSSAALRHHGRPLDQLRAVSLQICLQKRESSCLTGREEIISQISRCLFSTKMLQH